VIEAEAVRKAYGNNLLIDDLNFKLPPGGIVGVIGPNGAGKTTLFRMITGQEQPDSGTLRVGETVNLGYVDQSRDSLNPDRTVWQEISGGDEVSILASGRSSPALTSRRSTSRVPISKRRSAFCRAASATECTWRRC